MTFNINKKDLSTSEFVYQTLKNKILLMEIHPNEKISEVDMAQKLETSRVPVREAFIRLNQEKLLTAIPKSGTIISKISIDKIEEGIFIRKAVDEKVMLYALPKIQEKDILMLKNNIESCWDNLNNVIEFIRLDQEFHNLFYTVANKNLAWQFIFLFNSDYFRVRVLNSMRQNKLQKTVEEHTEILTAVMERDVEKVLDTTKCHFNSILDDLKFVVQEYPEYFI